MFNHKAIARKREKLGMSQAKLKELSGIRIENISRLENGKQMNPTLLTLESLAKALQCKVSDLIISEKHAVI